MYMRKLEFVQRFFVSALELQNLTNDGRHENGRFVQKCFEPEEDSFSLGEFRCEQNGSGGNG
jgi:hypothetical protein